MERVDVLMEEYKTLREESLRAIQHQHTILQFGVTALGALLAFSVNVSSRAATILLLVVVPSLALLVSVIWTSELHRKYRAGGYLAHVEEEINAELGDQNSGLGWERQLQKEPRLRIKYNNVAVGLLLSVISVFSAWLGFLRLQQGHQSFIVRLVTLALSGTVLLGTAVWYLYAQRIIGKVKP